MPRFMSARSTAPASPMASWHVLIEANVGEGVISAPLSKYLPYHTRLCRPVGLSHEDRVTVCRYAINRIGFGYDTKNIVDLMRYLIPLPVPQRWRRRMIAFGSGDPTKIICSALIAPAFGAVRYPILPKITRAGSRNARRRFCTFAISRSICREISISLPISRSSSPRSCGVSITSRSIGPTSRSRSRRWRVFWTQFKSGRARCRSLPRRMGLPRRWKR